jgi:hypothetical protein
MVLDTFLVAVDLPGMVRLGLQGNGRMHLSRRVYITSICSIRPVVICEYDEWMPYGRR